MRSKGVGRESDNTTRINISLPNATLERIKQIAEEECRSVAAQVSWWGKAAVEKHSQKEERDEAIRSNKKDTSTSSAW